MNYRSITKTLGLHTIAKSDLDLVAIARKGIPRKSIGNLALKMKLSVLQLSESLHVSKRTLQRYKDNDLLSASLSDKVIQITKIYNRALEVFEDEDYASLWLKEQNMALGNNSPIDLLDTTSGMEMVLDVLGRLEYGGIS